MQLPPIEFEQHQLENGLQVILHPDSHSRLAHVTIHYRVGSSCEAPGMSGFAHLFEHMMFQGSTHIAKNQHGQLIDTAGGTWNATTNKDRTNYYETVPDRCLDLALWLEAERMSSLKVTEENFENQRRTVIEEKKQSYDNRPYGRAYLRLDELSYGNWAYGHSVIGEVEDLENATVDMARRFHSDYYRPNNAVLCLSGAFEPETALARIREYFGSIERGTPPPKPDLSEPPQNEGKFEVVEDRLASLSAVYMSYHMPEMASPEYFALSMLAGVLVQGDSSRFQRELVRERNWVTSLSLGPNNYKGPQLFNILFMIREGIEPRVVVERIEEMLAEVQEHGVTDGELEGARKRYAYRFISSQARASGIGETLARSALYRDDPNAANLDAERFLSIEREDVRTAAQRIFQPNNRTMIEVRPVN